MDNRYNIAIIGTGPAGLSAALNAKIRNKSFILFGNSNLSTKISRAHQINNYLGFHNKSGEELKNIFQSHIKDMEIDIANQNVKMIYDMGDYFSILDGNNDICEAQTIIIATGVNFGKPLEGEEEFLGKGVGYCATCDAPLYKNKNVAIIGHSKNDEHEANFVSEIAKKVYYIPMYNQPVNVNSAVEVIKDTPIKIIGEEVVSMLILKGQELTVDGVFILRENTSPSNLISGLEMDGNHIKVDRLMRTNIDGCFAAGDIVGAPYQYIKSAGEGNIAALSAVAYIDKHKNENNFLK